MSSLRIAFPKFKNDDNVHFENKIYTKNIDDKIVGGNETTIEQHPYQVSLRYRGFHYCGGSILTPTRVLTAAACIQPNPIPSE